MKKLVFLVVLVAVFVACKKDKAIVTDSLGLQQQADWKTEKFKSDYTIQFPDFYSGGYVQGFEGGFFEKVRDDSHIAMSYLFTDGLQSYDFGDTLADENATSIDLPQGDVLLFLNQRINITHHEVISGILFYNNVQGIRTGELYWRDKDVFRDALTIYYDSELENEMTSILKTIQHQ